jgi:hypothetical protein
VKADKPKRRYMRSFKLNEISAVDQPAQEHALAAITKSTSIAMRREPNVAIEGLPFNIEKRSILTSAEAGHTHLIVGVDDVQAGTTSGERMSATGDYYDSYHSHPWVKNTDGSITIGEAAGHMHAAMDGADDTGKRAPRKETAMPTEKTENEKRLETELAKFRVLAEMTDAQKAHYRTLTETDQASFVAKSATDREAEVAKAGEVNKVVFTSADGTEYRAKDDPRLVKLAKERDEDRVRLAKRELELETERLEKRAATELPHLKGTVQVRAAMLKAVEAIADEAVRKDALEALKGADHAYGEAMKNIGHGGNDIATNGALATFDKELGEFAKTASKSKEAATSDFLATQRGAELYEKAYPRVVPQQDNN